MIQWQLFPKNLAPPNFITELIRIFEDHHYSINSENHELQSNEVLAILSQELLKHNYQVEVGKKAAEKINIPVLYGKNGKVEKSFDADAYHSTYEIVLEVEAGRAVVNNQFLKDLFQACMMQSVLFLSIAVRIKYRDSKDFEKVTTFFETLFASDRISLPLKGILIIGY